MNKKTSRALQSLLFLLRYYRLSLNALYIQRKSKYIDIYVSEELALSQVETHYFSLCSFFLDWGIVDSDFNDPEDLVEVVVLLERRFEAVDWRKEPLANWRPKK